LRAAALEEAVKKRQKLEESEKMRGDLNSSAVTASQSKQKALDFAEFKKLHSLKVRGPSEPVGNL
jgi:hypothetical protein